MDSALEEWGTATREWIGTGHKFRIAPSTGMTVTAIVVLALIGAGLGGATLAGLSVNPAPAGYAFGAAVMLIPAAGICLLILYRRNAGLFVDSSAVGRTGVFGKVVASAPRARVVAVAVRKGSYAEWFKTDLSGETKGPDDNVMCLVLKGGRITMTTKMYLYSVRQAELLSAVLGVPLKTHA